MLKILFIFVLAWLYLLVGFIFDVLQSKYLAKDDYFEPSPLALIFWPLGLTMIIMFTPFYLVAKLFKID